MAYDFDTRTHQRKVREAISGARAQSRPVIVAVSGACTRGDLVRAAELLGGSDSRPPPAHRAPPRDGMGRILMSSTEASDAVGRPPPTGQDAAGGTVLDDTTPPIVQLVAALNLARRLADELPPGASSTGLVVSIERTQDVARRYV